MNLNRVKGFKKSYIIMLITILTVFSILSACSSSSELINVNGEAIPSRSVTTSNVPVTPSTINLLTSPYTVAAVSAASVEFDLNASITRANELTARAANSGATLVTFGELWLPGYPKQLNYDEDWADTSLEDYVKNAIEIGSPEWENVVNIASSNKVYLSIGFAEREDNHLYISQALIDPEGKVIQIRRKVRPSGTERKFFSDDAMSRNLRVYDTSLGRVGMLECWEHLHPQMTYPMHAQTENLHIAAFPYLPSDSESPQWWENTDVAESAARYYAINGSTWVITPAVGEAFIMNPQGEIVSQATPNMAADFVLAKIDPSQFANTTQYSSSGEYSWGVLNLIRDAYKGPQEEDPEHGELNMVDISSFQ